ncbi:14619_t:CDS:2, partial [Gigaspora rosea]
SRTPEFWLKPGDSTPYPCFSITDVPYVYIDLVDGKWVGSYSIQRIQSQSIIFNNNHYILERTLSTTDLKVKLGK